MIRSFILSFVIFVSSNAVAGMKTIQQNYKFTDFEAAKKASSKLKFTIQSTKAGLFTSDVDGYVKSFAFKAQFDDTKQVLNDMEITFHVKDMDTDNGSRNEKLQGDCMDIKNNPIVTVHVAGPFPLHTKDPLSLKGLVNLRGGKEPFETWISAKKNGSNVTVFSRSTWGFKEMKIPDPSIMIASVSNDIRIFVQLEKDLTN